jgi:hypothetical protein
MTLKPSSIGIPRIGTPTRTPHRGIGIVAAGTTVSRNRADHNAEYGIYAVPGTIDGGGNRAKHNGNPAQCVGVRCNAKDLPEEVSRVTLRDIAGAGFEPATFGL